MKLYYVLTDVMPNEQNYFIAADGGADMDTPVYLKGQVIDWTTAKSIKDLHGKGLTAVVDVEPFANVTKVISFVDDMGCTHSHRYYIPAL